MGPLGVGFDGVRNQSGDGAIASGDNLIGAHGVAVTELRPGGEVEIAGKRYEASVEIGDIAAGSPIVVRRRADFRLIVERVES